MLKNFFEINFNLDFICSIRYAVIDVFIDFIVALLLVLSLCDVYIIVLNVIYKQVSTLIYIVSTFFSICKRKHNNH